MMLNKNYVFQETLGPGQMLRFYLALVPASSLCSHHKQAIST